MPDQDGEKSQDATPHRRQQAREKGQVPRSQDLGSAAILVAGIVVLLTLGGTLIEAIGGFMMRQIGGDAWLTADIPMIMGQWDWMIDNLAFKMLAIIASISLVAILINLMQVGILFVPDKLKPDPSHINPLKGLKRLVSLQSVMRLGFGIFKILIVAVVAALSLYSKRYELFNLASLEVPQIGAFILDAVLWTALKIGIALLILAILDYAFQLWKFEQDLKMTQQEVREEMKNLQGDPQVIARRRQVQRQMALQRMSSDVPTADVVVTNPTELAVAIKYNPQEMAAPIVVAKGAGVIAQKIRRLALEYSIPIVENKPLARQLYKDVEAGAPITDKSYAAVAEVLAYVYQLKGKTIPGA